MDEIALFINDLSTSPTLEKDLSMITWDPDSAIVRVEYVWVGPNGIGDHVDQEIAIEKHPGLSQLEDEINNIFDHVLTMDDLLYNEPLIHYYLQENDPVHLQEIDQLYISMLTSDYKNKESIDDYVSLAVGMQLYGQFLETYDFPRCTDAYRREKDLLEDVAEVEPSKENLQNAVVGYQDIIRVYEKLGDDFSGEVLNLYLSLLRSRRRFDETYDYELGHIYERIGILYAENDTLEDMDGIDNDEERLRLSIRYHHQEKEIFASLYKKTGDPDDAYNYGIALRQLGLRYESLGRDTDLEQANRYFSQAFEIFSDLYDQSEAYRDTYIIAVEHLGNIAYDRHQDVKALGYYMEVAADEKNSAHSGQAADLFSVAVIEKKLGKVYDRLGYREEACEAFAKALDYVRMTLEQADDYSYRAEEGIAYMNLGWHYMATKDYDRAYAYFNQDYQLRCQLYQEYQSVTAHYSLSLAMRHMGYVLETLGHYDQALKFFNDCLAIAAHYVHDHEREGEKHYYEVSLYDYGHAAMLNGQYELALSSLSEVERYLLNTTEYMPHEYPLSLAEVVQDENKIKECLDD